jgi:hypothetical protein
MLWNATYRPNAQSDQRFPSWDLQLTLRDATGMQGVSESWIDVAEVDIAALTRSNQLPEIAFATIALLHSATSSGNSGPHEPYRRQVETLR